MKDGEEARAQQWWGAAVTSRPEEVVDLGTIECCSHGQDRAKAGGINALTVFSSHSLHVSYSLG